MTLPAYHSASFGAGLPAERLTARVRKPACSCPFVGAEQLKGVERCSRGGG